MKGSCMLGYRKDFPIKRITEDMQKCRKNFLEKIAHYE
jgi:hypothetical protein